jgi:hypothetical protein
VGPYKLNKDQLRQGDVFFVRVASLPPDAEKVDTHGGRLVIAHGEATGHVHAFEFHDGELYRTAGGAQFVNVIREGAQLLHDEHSAVTFPKGIWKRAFQTEYSPQALRTVAD